MPSKTGTSGEKIIEKAEFLLAYFPLKNYNPFTTIGQKTGT
jgi:hypothetical protein